MRYNVAFEVTIKGQVKKEFKCVNSNSNNYNVITKIIKDMYPKNTKFNFKRISEAKTANSEII